MKLRSRLDPPPLDRPARLPLALAVALALAAVAQLFGDIDGEPPAAEPMRGRRAIALAGEAAPRVPVQPVILARSMFAPSAAPGVAQGASALAGPLGGAIIVGSVRIGRAAYAVVQGPGSRLRNVRVGGRIAGWRLRRLAASEALLERGSERLAIRFGSAGSVPAPGPQGEERGDDGAS